jgi:hypothetical protein
MRSAHLEWDFQLLLKVHDNVDADGIVTWDEPEQNEAKRQRLENGYDDFKAAWDFLQTKMIAPGGKHHRIWGTSLDLSTIVERSLKRKVMHGALLLALELMGHHLDIVDDTRYVTIRLPKESAQRLK